MQSLSHCSKGSKIHLFTQMLIQLCPVAVKESSGITNTRCRTVGRVSYSDRELLSKIKVKLQEI